jgi:hypothetical protein
MSEIKCHGLKTTRNKFWKKIKMNKSIDSVTRISIFKFVTHVDTCPKGIVENKVFENLTAITKWVA